jgi:O-antigen/teichoic acid export membrane protein
MATQLFFIVVVNIRQVLFSSFTEMVNNNVAMDTAINRTTETLLLISALIAVLQFHFTDQIVPILFNEKWQLVAPVIKWLSLGLFLTPISVVYGARLMAQGKFKPLAVLTGLQTIIIISGAIFGGLQNDIVMIAVGVSVGVAVSNILFGMATIILNRSSMVSFYTTLIKPFCLFVFLMVVGLVFNHVLVQSLLNAFLMIIAIFFFFIITIISFYRKITLILMEKVWKQVQIKC